MRSPGAKARDVGKDDNPMDPQMNDPNVIFVDSQAEMNVVSRTLKPGQVVALRDIDPEVLDHLVNFEWTEENEACLLADSEPD